MAYSANIGYCPKCNHDLTSYLRYENVDMFLNCPECNEKLFLHLEIYDYYDEDDCYDYNDIWEWKTAGEEEFEYNENHFPEFIKLEK